MKRGTHDNSEVIAAKINSKAIIVAAFIALIATVCGTILGGVLEFNKGQAIADQEIQDQLDQAYQKIEELEKQINTNESSIKIENIEIETVNSPLIIAGGNTGEINQININNYSLPNDSDEHTENDSKQETNRGVEFFTEIKVRVADCDDKTWRSTIDAKAGDIVEFQMQYRNISNESHRQVVVRDVLPRSLEYVEGSTVLYNANYPDGIKAVQDTITTEGVNIGNYAASANAFIRFRAEVVDETLADGLNLLYNWGQVQAGSAEKVILQDDACVIVNYKR